MEARVTSQSQTFRLVEKMEQASIHHGQEIRADLPNVRVLALAGGGEGQVLFCNVGPIRVREILNRGDDRPLPTDVRLEGLEDRKSTRLNSSHGYISYAVFCLK